MTEYIAGWIDGFLVSSTGFKVLSSYKNSLSQTASFVVWVYPIYFASKLDKVIVGCCFDNQLIVPLSTW